MPFTNYRIGCIEREGKKFSLFLFLRYTNWHLISLKQGAAKFLE